MSNKMSEIIESSINSIKSMVDGNTVIGEAITTANGTMIIPVSKLSMGFATGGIDYQGKAAAESGKITPNNFGGGGGTGVTCSPVAFLVISADGKVELLSVNSPAPSDPVSNIVGAIERSPELIGKFKTVLSKKDKDKKEEESCDA